MTNAVNLASAAGTGFFRNKIINGAMEIDQRNGGASITLGSSGLYGVDRWFGTEDTDGTMTMQQSSIAPSGFKNSIVLTTGTADASLSALQYALVGQAIEGYNVADLAYGTADAKTTTLSFWVRSSLTGVFGGAFKNIDSNRSYAFTYTISAADTWEYKTVTVPGDTSGTWSTVNTVGLFVTFGLGSGSTYSGTAGSWASANYVTATGATSVIGTSGATFYITGVQLEVGSVATPFERRNYQQELAMCQRYYEINVYSFLTMASGGYGNSYSSQELYKVTKRVSPTVTVYSGANRTGTVGSATLSSGGVNSVEAVVLSSGRINGHSIQRNGSAVFTLAQYSYTADAEF